MKLFFISDIHGSVYYLEKALERYEEEKADYIIILGDILYHGARNPLPKGYNPKGVIELLNKLSKKIIAVRGNCDSEVDQMVLDFPLSGTYSNLLLGEQRLFLTHGHIYNKDKMVELEEGSVFVYGHTHIPELKKIENIIYFNPGSMTLPKEDNPRTYGVMDESNIEIKTLDGEVFKKLCL
ncbi:MAG TPA: phosphodiesterase [Tissierellaceae bacterium]